MFDRTYTLNESKNLAKISKKEAEKNGEKTH
jgi:hypothetical protein